MAAVDTDQLRFNFGKPQHAKITADVYTHYHGDLIATFLNRFDRAYWGRARIKPKLGHFACNVLI